MSKPNIKYELIIYWSTHDESFIVEVPELAGCKADGETLEVAIVNVKLVIQDWIKTANELGREIPKPKDKLVYA